MSTDVKRLYRSRFDRWFAGVCGGLGRYFGIDLTLVRALFVLFGLVVGGGILAYLLLWLIIPLKPEEAGQLAEEPPPVPADTEQE